MVKTKDELMASIKSKFGDDTSDETIALLEDISDTLDTTKDGADWKKKFEDNDKMWREKYTSRFFDTPADQPKPNDGNPSDDTSDNDGVNEDVTIDDLFTEKEK